MAATIFKAGGLAAVVCGGAFALLQANAGMSGTLAAAQPAGRQWPDDAFPAAAPAPAGEPAGALFFPEADWRVEPADEPPAFGDEPAWDASFADETPGDPAPELLPVAAEEPPDPFGERGAEPAAPAADDRLPDLDELRPDLDEFSAEPTVREFPEERTEPRPQPSPTRRPLPNDLAASGAANLSVRKDAPATAVPGEAFVYTITVANVGGAPVRGVVVEEAVPAGATLEGTNPRADRAGDVLRWAFDSLPPGDETVLSVRVVPDRSGTVGGVTVVRSEVAVAARTSILAPELSLAVAPVPEARAGRPFDLTLTVTNVGSADAAGVAVRTLLPPGVSHASGERDLQYDVGPLPAGESRTVVLTLAADAPGGVRFDCELTAANAAAATTVAAVDVRDRQLTLTRRGPRTRFVGRAGTFVNTVRNASNAPSAPVTVREVVPVGFAYDASTAGGRFDPAARTVTWAVPALPAGGSAEVAVTLVAESQGEAETRVALLAGDRTESELAAVTAVRGYIAVAPRVRGLNGPLAVGERVAVHVSLENTGTEPAGGVVVNVTLPPSVRAADWIGDFRDELTATGLRFTAKSPIPAGGTASAEIILEGVSAGGGSVGLTVSADGLPASIRRDEPVQVYADAAE